jgi:hypothetical protein
MTKEAMIEAMYKFIGQRSGIEYANYGSREAFNGDYRPMLKDGQTAKILLYAVALRNSITSADLINASRAYSGRLQFAENGKGVYIDYTTGQYFPTEYRCAACAVLAQALWDFWKPDHKTGEEIRKQARKEFGRGIAARWFN